MKFSIIIINYKSRAYLEKCLETIFAKIKFNAFEVIVVNNGKYEELEGLADIFLNIKIIQNKNNQGFGSGNNLGAKNARGEVLFFLNPDTEIFLVDFSEILEEFVKNNQLGIVGSRLFLENNITQDWSAGCEINLTQIIKNNLGMRNNVLGEKKQEVAWVSGTAMFIRKKLFEELGGFDENFFMYFEDVDLCRRVRKLGKKVLFSPAISVLHYGGKSYDNKKKQKKQYYASQDYYIKKYFGFSHLVLLKFLRLFSL